MNILQKVKYGVLGVAAVAALALGCVISPAYAADPTPTPTPTPTDCESITDVAKRAECYAGKASGGNNESLFDTLQKIINVVLGVIGFVATAIIVYGGVQYTISSGDAAKVSKAKNTIIYGVVGLIVALLAAAIVNFVLAGVFGA